eukprot:2516369-Rhodomonas_salina.1
MMVTVLLMLRALLNLRCAEPKNSVLYHIRHRCFASVIDLAPDENKAEIHLGTAEDRAKATLKQPRMGLNQPWNSREWGSNNRGTAENGAKASGTLFQPSAALQPESAPRAGRAW